MTEPMCPRAGKLFRGCCFEGRYDTPVASRFDELYGGLWMTATPMPGDPTKAELARPVQPKKTYVRDICRTCGRTIERQGSAA